MVAIVFPELQVLQVVEQKTHAYAGTVFAAIGTGCMQEGRSCNVKMHPGIIGVALQEFAGRDGSANAAADVLHVGDIGLEQLIVLLPEWKLRQSFVYVVPAPLQLIFYFF